VNSDPYGAGWMIKVTLADATQVASLLEPEAYERLTAGG
jgi:glycine cleavage system H protein